MGIMSRMLRLWKADMHGVMDQLEDKALLLKQYLREMEASLEQKQANLKQLRRTCEQIRNDFGRRTKEKENIEKDIELAVRKEKDDIARNLIRKRITLTADIEHFEVQLSRLIENEERLTAIISEQQGQYERLKIKAAAYCKQAEERSMEDSISIWSEPVRLNLATEDEVELELMRFKETFSQGGAA